MTSGEINYDFPVTVAPIAGRGNGHQRRALAIVGSHPTGLEGVPWDDPDVEILLFNEAPLKTVKYFRWNHLLQIHGQEVYTSLSNWQNVDYWPWLQQDHGNNKIWMQEVDPRIPNSVKYPLKEILKLVPYHYLRSSAAMAIALSIYLGYSEIQLFGCELTSNTEYAYQATNAAFWIGFAHGLGIDFQLRCWLTEFDQRIYGYEGELQIGQDYYLARLAEHEAAWKENENKLSKLKSRMDDAMVESRFDEVAELSLEIETAAIDTGHYFGSMGEAKRYSERQDMISRQEFEKTSAKAQKAGDELRTETAHAGGKCEYVWNAWKQSGRFAALAQLREFLTEKTQLAYDTGVQHGLYIENLTYMTEYDARLLAAGGVRALGRAPEQVTA